MSFHFRKDRGVWYVKYYESGQQKKIYTGAGSEGKNKAQALDAELKEKRTAGEPVIIDRPERVSPGPVQVVDKDHDCSFMWVADQYLETKPLSENTAQHIRYALNSWVEPLFGHKAIADLSMADFVSLDQALLANTRTKFDKKKKKKITYPAPASVATRNRYKAYCRAVLAWGVDQELIETNPFAKFKPDRKREGKAPDLITPAELEAIQAKASPHLAWAIRCVLNLGVRPGEELFSIKISDVDYERGGIWLKRAKVKASRKLQECRPAFLEEVRALKPFLKETKDKKGNKVEQEIPRVYLVEYEGARVKSLKTAWANALRRAKIKRRIRLHDLRHLYCTRLIESGAPLPVVAELLGHADTQMVSRTYYHLQSQMRRKAVDDHLPDW